MGPVRRVRRVAFVTLAFVAVGCYTMRPITTTAAPEVGTRLEVTVNDAGRVALGRTMGPEIDRIEGMLLEGDSAGMSLAVKHVYGLRGEVQVWSDEVVRIDNEYVRMLSERRFSRAKSVAFGAAGIGGFAFLVSIGLNAFGLGDPNVPPDSMGEEIIRVVRP